MWKGTSFLTDECLFLITFSVFRALCEYWKRVCDSFGNDFGTVRMWRRKKKKKKEKKRKKKKKKEEEEEEEEKKKKRGEENLIL